MNSVLDAARRWRWGGILASAPGKVHAAKAPDVAWRAQAAYGNQDGALEQAVRVGPSMESDPNIEARRDIERIVERLNPEDRKYLRELPESELIRLHFRWGMWLRNQFRQNEFPHLFRFCHAKVPAKELSFDEVSAVAIREIWLHIRSTGTNQLQT